ncbi:aldo/keto reductase [Phenylobacterium sp.]|uniref:aldo/keto reductase n=1 Tax=Phenylobacterium sp. TaxID=1871053 RepID=UPI0027322FAE|nr:aldo/keto reductase [Phenylobacterium sp.]MDP3659818.1 aldo/keto reductase [Phenylobacterium sp.]
MSDLERRQLGRTGLSVTVLGFGAMDLGGPPAANEITDDEAGAVLNAVLDAGINFIDTAVCYGVSEERIGKAISGRRDEFVLATKCGCTPGAGMGGPHVHTQENIRAGVEHSLRTMKTDHLDVAQFHRSLTRKGWEEDGALEELLKLKQEGKVRYIGVSGTLPELAEQVDAGVFDVFQIPYSALQREHEAIIAKASAAGAGIIIRGAVARGAPDNWDKRYYMLSRDEMTGRWEQAKLDDLMDGMGRIEFMTRFALASPDLDTTIIGTKSLEHLRSNVEAARKGPLPADVVAEAKRRLDATASRPS